jgi:hypothetical protein
MDDQLFFLIAVGLAAAAAGHFYRRKRAMRLPDVTDATFIEHLLHHQSVEISPDAIIRERTRVARILSVPPAKLAPPPDLDRLI